MFLKEAEERRIESLFVLVQELAQNSGITAFPSKTRSSSAIMGLVPHEAVSRRVAELQAMSIEEYIAQVVGPAEGPGRPSARSLISEISRPSGRAIEQGPLYADEVDLATPAGNRRRVGIIAQERTTANGIWQPVHHREAARICREFAAARLPIVTLIDTPGADASTDANRHNQAHSISHLIAEIANVDVPVVAVVVGYGYSGGAIPLATANVLLSLPYGLFNTIQPRGLASIARSQGLSWQECARIVGVSAYELCYNGYIDGVIDYGEDRPSHNLVYAITTAIAAVEESAAYYVDEYPEIFEQYARNVARYINPTGTACKVAELSQFTSPANLTEYPSIFGEALKLARHLNMRRRLRFTTGREYAPISQIQRHAAAAGREEKYGDSALFRKWCETPLAVRYEPELAAAWKSFQSRRRTLNEQLAHPRQISGNQHENYLRSLERLTLTLGFYLYNLWKQDAPGNFRALLDWLGRQSPNRGKPPADATVLDIILDLPVYNELLDLIHNMLLLDALYQGVIRHLPKLARAALTSSTIQEADMAEVLASALQDAALKLPEHKMEEVKARFLAWFRQLHSVHWRKPWLRRVQEWKMQAHPQLAAPLFTIVTYVFTTLFPEYAAACAGVSQYRGELNLRNIGMRDFWNRLDLAFKDLLILEVLADSRNRIPTTAAMIISEFFSEYTPTDSDLRTLDPAHFPGLRQSIEQALDQGITPCGVITCIATLKNSGRRVGAVISNSEFQAGALDMAGAEKICRLLVRCARERLPVLCFISSGGMQTKEGAGALFSMAVINDRLTHFIKDCELPVVCFGFGDCTGGAQASLVTHPLVQTYYFSGTNMPFAGQAVVQEHLPLSARLSNYLSLIPGAMRGLVRHPFITDLDQRLRGIDPEIPIARLSGAEVIESAIQWEILPATVPAEKAPDEEASLCRPFRRVLIHARGCTSVRLVERAQSRGLEVVLVQSDADIHSVAATMLRPCDRLVCLGGSTPADSYLNGMSVIRIAKRENAEAIHPGVGFLSESPDFAEAVRRQGLIFIGPRSASMARMGNKSNAIETACELGIPVVPGSFGVVTDAAAAAQIAEEIGYPVLIKAVHGGGGRGIGIAHDLDELKSRFALLSTEALSAFGNGDLYIEKYITRMRHIEVQLLRDHGGSTRVLGLRDCSIQRNRQKILEESGSTMLPQQLKETASMYAVLIAERIDYLGAGTVEFIYDLESRQLYFMEMNTRLQIEHLVTELASGTAIVDAQYEIAAGGDISGVSCTQDGYAIEVRINADHLKLGADGVPTWSPNSGTITECVLPPCEHITVVSSIRSGSLVSPYYDSMIVQIIARGPDRMECITRLAEYLKKVRICGVYTNLSLLKAILQDPVFRAGEYDTGYIDGLFRRIDSPRLIAEGEREAAVTERRFNRRLVEIEGSTELRVLAPRVGVFYHAASSVDPPLVKEGDLITRDKTFGLLEVMKIFTELNLASYNNNQEQIYDAFEYQVTRVAAANGQLVNPGDLLLVVNPLP